MCPHNPRRELPTIPKIPVNTQRKRNTTSFRDSLTAALQKHRFQFDEFNADLNQQLVDVVAVGRIAIRDVTMK